MNMTQLRNTILAAGASAIMPLSASAMVTEHDTKEMEPEPGIEIDKRLSGDLGTALADRFGTYSGIGVQGSRSVETRSDTGTRTTPGEAGNRQRNDLYLQLP